jgi:molybdopterin synthase sulfur carrier subunit
VPDVAPLKILYFAWLRERLGRGDEDIPLPEGVSTVGGLITWLQARDDAHRAAFANPGVVRAAVNQVFARSDTVLRAGDEVAFFPPVTGG